MRPPGGSGLAEPVPGAQGHRCARAGRCLRAEVDARSGWRLGAATATSDTLCDGCAGAVRRALDALPGDYLSLELIVDQHTRHQEKVSGSRELPVPPRLDILDLQAAIDTELSTWVEPVAEALRIDWDTQAVSRWRPGPRTSRAARLLAAQVPVLLALGPVDIVVPGSGGPRHATVTTRTGVEAAVCLLDHHQRARLLVSGGTGDARLPVPCPRCEGVLIRPNGMSHVGCRSCGSTWPEHDYQRLCLVLAEDYRVVAA